MKHIRYDVCVYDILDIEYPQILSKMLGEDFFIIQDKVYDFFYEITYYGCVVGFICGNFEEECIVCELAYIIPRYRNLGLFCKSVKSLDNLFESELVLFLPNHYAVLSLIHNGLAFRLKEGLVFSGFRLCFNNPNGEGRIFSYLYDLDNCCIVSLSRCLVSPLLDDDVRSLLYTSGRCITDEYFVWVRKVMFGLM